MTLTTGSETAIASSTAAADKTARRLLGSSSKNSYDPFLDIDWSAKLDEDAVELSYMPLERTSLYGTKLWDEMTQQQRLELAKQELASIASTGLWFEIILIQMLTRHVYHRDARDAATQYALTEIGDETRHVIMFAKTLEAMDVPHYRPNAVVHHSARLYKALARGPLLFAPVLVAEEVTDRLQRSTMNDEQIHPLIRMVNRIHVVEEARHVRFAREEVTRVTPELGRFKLAFNQLVTAIVSAAVVDSLISPKVYAEVGLDPKRARREARKNPNFHETRRWMAEKIMAFLQESGLVPRWTKPVYRSFHLL